MEKTILDTTTHCLIERDAIDQTFSLTLYQIKSYLLRLLLCYEQVVITGRAQCVSVLYGIQKFL